MSRHHGHFFSNITFRSDGRGAICRYCCRILEATTSGTELAACREHLHPKSKGGRKRVWACKKCDTLKGNKSKPEWEEFMRTFPEWWKWKVLNHEV